MTHKKEFVTVDKPINNTDDDALNFSPYADKIKKIIQGYGNQTDPLVIGIYGKWGEGKTSLLNLLKKQIELYKKKNSDKGIIYMNYSPWLYHDKNQMLLDFFHLLSKKFEYSDSSYLKPIGKLIEKYSIFFEGATASASFGISKYNKIGVSLKLGQWLANLGKALQGTPRGLEELKKEINDKLEGSNNKILIFIDDVDRLDKEELFTLFKLIKINADFKNLIFIVCMDPIYVAKAIYHRYGNSIQDGFDFLEKIINIPLVLPLVEEIDLNLYAKQKVQNSLETRSINYDLHNDLIYSIEGRFFTTPRQIIRTVNAFTIALHAIGDEVNIHDLFWIEYLKVNHVEVYNIIKSYAGNHKTNILPYYISFSTSVYTQGVTKLPERIEIECTENQLAIEIFDKLFPLPKNENKLVVLQQGETIRKDRELDSEFRINHINHFEKYFSFHTINKLSEVKFSLYKSLIENKSKDAVKILKEIIENSDEHRVIYRLISEINKNNASPDYVHIKFLVSNMDLFRKFNDITYSADLIRNIGEKLGSHASQGYNIPIFSIFDQLDHEGLFWLLKGLESECDTKNTYIKEIEKKIIDKIKSSSSLPFYKDRKIGKRIMEIWAKQNPVELQNYLLETLNSEERFGAFLSCFTNLWNKSINGVFKKEDYDFLADTLKIDCNKLIERLIELHVEDFDPENTEKSENWDEKKNNSILDNIQQFAFRSIENSGNGI